MIVNKYIDYINTIKEDSVISSELYKGLIQEFKMKLEHGIMGDPRSSEDLDFIEITMAIKHISDELSLIELK
jgi:hypothetical protein